MVRDRYGRMLKVLASPSFGYDASGVYNPTRLYVLATLSFFYYDYEDEYELEMSTGGVSAVRTHTSNELGGNK